MLPVRKPIAIIDLLRKRALIVLTLLFLLAGFIPAIAFAEISRPAPKDQPTVVTADIYILDIDEVDTAGQSFDANVFIELSWQDPRLVHAGEGKVVKLYGEIWSPQIQIANMQRTWKTYPDRLIMA